MTKLRLLLIAFGACLIGAPASAQEAVTTIGSSDAAICYRNAQNDFSSETAPCDAALAGSLTRKDRKSTLVNRGIIHKRNGDLQRGLDDFNEALEMDPGLAEAYLNRGTVYFLAGYNDEAIADYQKAIDLGTTRPWAAWYNMGLAYEEKNDKAKAREAYAKALELNPSFAPARERLSQLG